jgi:hypothetical protein
VHNLIAAVLVLFAGWTVSTQLAVLLGLSLSNLIVLAPAVICLTGFVYFRVVLSSPRNASSRENESSSAALIPVNRPPVPVLFWLCAVPLIVYLSWLAFWFSSLLVLAYYVLKRDQSMAATPAFRQDMPLHPYERAVVTLACAGAVLLTLAVSRSDLDDTFYVAVTAFAAGHPHEPLLAFDPMHVERSWPLIFPSYRFATFELFGAALAHLLSVPAMDAVYRIVPPFGAVLTVLCIFLYSQELMPRRWLLLGATTLVFILILGEAHRAPANFTFVRMFQGKAIYLSAILPAIFYLTARYLSPRGTSADAFLLACAQITAIGLSNFSILAAPMAGTGALLSNYILLNRQSKRKFWCVVATLSIALPYLIAVMLSSHGAASLSQFETELPATVWKSVLGWRQHYFVAVLLLAGPILAGDKLLQLRLAVPMLLLLAVYLNPWLSPLISRFVTTPPVYWRVMWSFPLLVAAAAGFCLVIEYVRGKATNRIFPVMLGTVVLFLLAVSIPFHTLRSDNDIRWDFAGKKISPKNYEVAQAAVSIMEDDVGRLLAPDEISGIVAMFETHPVLVNARSLYIGFLAPAMGEEESVARQLLHDFVSGAAESAPAVRAALNSLNVATVVINRGSQQPELELLLLDERFRRAHSVHDYNIWHRNLPPS